MLPRVIGSGPRVVVDISGDLRPSLIDLYFSAEYSAVTPRVKYAMGKLPFILSDLSGRND